MKTFDIDKFEKNKTGNSFFFLTEDSSQVKQYEAQEMYWELIQPKGETLQMFYEYHKNGNLKRTVKKFPSDFALGVLKEYDEAGNLISEKDLDIPFKYSWENVNEYLELHGVDDIENQVVSITRWNNEERSTWTLEFNGKYDTHEGLFVIVLDGKTGEELEVKKFVGKGSEGETGTVALYETIYKKIDSK